MPQKNTFQSILVHLCLVSPDFLRVFLGGDVVAEWIEHGTLNVQVAGSNFSAVSWLTMCSTYIQVVPDLVRKSVVLSCFCDWCTLRTCVVHWNLPNHHTSTYHQ